MSETSLSPHTTTHLAAQNASPARTDGGGGNTWAPAGKRPSVVCFSAPDLHWNPGTHLVPELGPVLSHSVEGLQGVRGKGRPSHPTTQFSWSLSTTAANPSRHHHHQLLITSPCLDLHHSTHTHHHPLDHHHPPTPTSMC